MLIQEFDFDLPEHLIAQVPQAVRSQSRLMVLNKKTGDIQHQQFMDLPSLLRPNDLLVFNDTRVIPARLWGMKTTGGQVEILVERILTSQHFLAHVRVSKALKPNSRVLIAPDIELECVARHDSLFEMRVIGTRLVMEVLKLAGRMPLPPYITREAGPTDDERYQTVYARTPGAVAAPTAGLHFDDAMLSLLRQQGIETAFLTLHVGAGTFQPVRVDDIRDHHMHSEYFEITADVCDKIQTARACSGRVIAVGTTTVRSLETAAKLYGTVQPCAGETNIFIYPGFHFNVIDALITNFHLPKSTLLMLICAFAGQTSVLSAYAEAVRTQYRFFSYGDAMFLVE